MRVAICIGCNEYDFENPLGSAHTDAERMFEILTSLRFGGYDGERSKLLLSPNLQDVRAAFGEALYTPTEQIEDVTVFFAGHGGVVFETFYLGMRDTNFRRAALTGFSFSDLARIVMAAKPLQANIVVDACNSGGLALDLQSILKQSLVGAADSTGFSALAACASDEQAFEQEEGGNFTVQLANILSGRQIVQTTKPYLDLAEIGAAIRLDALADQRQTVSTWVLNLQGPNRFTLNPHYDNEQSRPDRRAENLGGRLNLSPQDVAAIRRLILNLPHDLDCVEVASTIAEVASRLPHELAADLIAGLAESLTDAARQCNDVFAPGRVLGAALGQLLKLVDVSQAASGYAKQLTDSILDFDWLALKSLNDSLDEDRYSLLSGGGLADLYFLPLRLADVLGRIGGVALGGRHVDRRDDLQNLTSRILEIYGNSILAVADEQAAPFQIFLTAALELGWTDLHEEVICRLFNDLVANHGLVARRSLDGKEALQCLRRRYNPVRMFDPRLHQQPSDLATVIVSFASLTRLDDIVDERMIFIDHLDLNFFSPAKLVEFGDVGPLEGVNLGCKVGHGIWTCADFRRYWRERLEPSIEPGSSEHNISAALSALSLEDRVPWFLTVSRNDIDPDPSISFRLL
ncbi:caspase family protein [Rhizobium leguminosarum]|uniref:caspase family protein n=1 Tax=Rhizobium leguminosarum TaxID=384 RepID=UPI0014426A7A|nr:caspase family protein [Rhizobium leguminosarum]NKL56246.1 hypothetical protein [Rhizobium leguminosarum bv. viciae]